jgi:hypothetical protein
MEINRADVAELVDARDLKFAAPAENKAFFCKTPAKFLGEPAPTNVICKTLPASEFQQKARTAGLRAAHVDAAAQRRADVSRTK